MRRKLRVVVDTNIFIKSWFKDIESCNQVLDLVEKNKIKLVFSQETIGELMYISKKYAIKNMSSNTPRIELLKTIAEIFYIADTVDTRKIKTPRIKDKTDVMFLKCAIAGNTDFIISDDFKSGLHRVAGIKTKVISSSAFIKNYNNISGVKKEIAYVVEK